MFKNGNRTHELGVKLVEIGDTIFQEALDMLFEGGYMSVKEFSRYGIFFSQKDLENLMYLREGTLNKDSKVILFMTIKSDVE